MSRVAAAGHERCRTHGRRRVPTRSRTETTERFAFAAARSSSELEIEKWRRELTEAEDQCTGQKARRDELFPKRNGHRWLVGRACLRLDHETIRDARNTQRSGHRVVQKRPRAERLGSRP